MAQPRSLLGDVTWAGEAEGWRKNVPLASLCLGRVTKSRARDETWIPQKQRRGVRASALLFLSLLEKAGVVEAWLGSCPRQVSSPSSEIIHHSTHQLSLLSLPLHLPYRCGTFFLPRQMCTGGNSSVTCSVGYPLCKAGLIAGHWSSCSAIRPLALRGCKPMPVSFWYNPN